MKIRDLMRPFPLHAQPTDSVATAGRAMSKAGVGVLPVIDADRKVIGVVTDRDICCALAGLDRRPSEVAVADVASTPACTCRANDDVGNALATMSAFGVRRLPVVDAANHLEGMLSLDEIVLASHAVASGRLDGPLHPELVSTLQAIVRPVASLIRSEASLVGSSA